MHMLWDVFEYTAVSGKTPFSNWLSKLKDKKGKQIIFLRLRRLYLGNFGDCQPIDGGVFELRIHYGPGYRLYFGRHQNQIILILCGGDKASQRNDIARAEYFWSDFKRRKNEAISRFSPPNN